MTQHKNIHENDAWSNANNGFVEVAEFHRKEAEGYAEKARLPLPDRDGIMRLVRTKRRGLMGFTDTNCKAVFLSYYTRVCIEGISSSARTQSLITGTISASKAIDRSAWECRYRALIYWLNP